MASIVIALFVVSIVVGHYLGYYTGLRRAVNEQGARPTRAR
jgi:hypothetical protein